METSGKTLCSQRGLCEKEEARVVMFPYAETNDKMKAEEMLIISKKYFGYKKINAIQGLGMNVLFNQYCKNR